MKEEYLIQEVIKEYLLFETKKKKKKAKRDACYYKVKSRYDVWPSAYASGALSKCRKVGAENWGNSTNEDGVFNIDELITEKRKLTSKPGSESNLRDWFKRKGAKGSTGGWVDCNTCREDKKSGRTKCKPCGRQEGEKRNKYPACRPTPGSCKKYKKSKGKSWGKKAMSEGLDYHLENNIPLTENIYRYGSESYFKLINEVRSLYNKGELELSETDQELISTDIGKRAIYEGRVVWLDILYEEGEEVSILTEAKYKGKNVPLNKPKRGGSKKFYVYTKNNKGNVIKVSFGAKSGGGNLAVKLRDPKARKAFADRHNCEQKNDKTKAGYWACRLPRYAKSLGLSGGGKWW